MLHIILAILKVIGVLLLIIIALILLLVLILCFVPVRYRLYVRYDNAWQGRANVRYLGPFLLIRVVYDGDIHTTFRICGIPFGGRKKSGKHAKKSRNKKQEDVEAEHGGEGHTDDAGVKKERYGAEYVKSVEELDDVRKPKEEPMALEAEPAGADKESLWGKLMRLWAGLKEKCRALLEMFRNIKQTISAVLEVYHDEGVRLGLSKGKEEILRLLKKCKPRKLTGYLRIGFEDPSGTGKLLAALAVLRGMWDYRVEVTPDFEHSIFETEVTAKGHIRGLWLLRIGWKLMFDKDIRYAVERGRGIGGSP